MNRTSFYIFRFTVLKSVICIHKYQLKIQVYIFCLSFNFLKQIQKQNFELKLKSILSV